MKRIIPWVLLLGMLCSCGFLQKTSYVAVSPHTENYGMDDDQETLTVSSYLGLKNAIANMVQDGTEEGTIRAESYSGDLSVDLSRAVYEVSQLSPLGAYAVGTMTYDFSRIVSYYEIHINTAYRRTREEIESIQFVTDTNALREALAEAMERYDARLVLRIGNYDALDLEAEVGKICMEHPEFALETPELSAELYPDSGTQRILDLKMTYSLRPEELEQCRGEMDDRIQELAGLYGSAVDDMTSARRLYSRLGRGGELLSRDDLSLSAGAYGALLEGSASARGYAQAYQLLLEASGIPCDLVTGQRLGRAHTWCMVQLDGAGYYVDPSQALNSAGGNDFLLGTRELEQMGYFWDMDQYPEVILPRELIPVSQQP